MLNLLSGKITLICVRKKSDGDDDDDDIMTLNTNNFYTEILQQFPNFWGKNQTSESLDLHY